MRGHRIELGRFRTVVPSLGPLGLDRVSWLRNTFWEAGGGSPQKSFLAEGTGPASLPAGHLGPRRKP